MKAKLQLVKKMLIALACIIPFTASGQTQISNEAQLRAIANDLTGDYILSSDITLTQEWIPIGNETTRFTGTINGNGKTIFGLKFKDLSLNGAGFIGVAEGAVVENLRIIGAEIYGGQDVGGIIGRAYAPTTVERCYTSGSFLGYDHIGGIIGGSNTSSSEGDMSLIKDCYSTAVITSTSWQAGGIIGTTINIEVINTYFAGIARCPSGRTGGIAALADGGTTVIENSVSLATTLRGDEANRVLGSIDGKNVDLANNYSWIETKVYDKEGLYQDGESNPYGVDGEHKNIATLKSAAFYNTTLGWNNTVWKIEEGKYPIFANQTYPINADYIYLETFPERAIPGNTHNTNMASALGRTITYNSSDASVASIDANGLVTFHKNGTTTLTFTTQGDAQYAGTTLTHTLEVKSISYNITTEEDLINIKYDLEGEFTLMNNITLTKNWTPIGTFKGKLNGNGKIIYGLRVDDRENRNKGLFSETEGATITKLGIEKAHIVGNEDVGAIVGNMKGGLIDQCYVADSYIEGRDHIGSIAGAMRSYDEITVPGDPDQGIEDQKEQRFATVRNSHAAAFIYSREFQAGGIVGIICGGTIEKCYFSGIVQSQTGRAAGIVSLVDNSDPGQIKDNMNLAVAGYCSQSTYRIGDWGSRGPESSEYNMIFINNWSKEQSYFGTDAKNSAVQDGVKDNNRNGSSLLNDNDARTQNFYSTTLGWDMTNTWKFVSGTEGKIYPILKWQEAPLTSHVYGIPESAFLTWYPGSDEALDLKKVISTTGETLTFSVIAGQNLVDLDGTLLYVTEGTLTVGGIATVGMAIDQSLSSVLDRKESQFNVEIVLRDAYSNVSSVQEFLNINNRLYAKFRLTQNINLTGVDFAGFGSSDTPFTGELDGNGFSIINPVIKTNGGNRKGLFNATDGAKIQKLGVVNISFEGTSTSRGVDIGGLVGSCRNTTIEQCYVTGRIVGTDHVGGFVGGNSDNVTIRNSYADVTIEAGQQAAGFFGVTAGTVTVENSYYAGSIRTTSRGWAGGIIGLIDRSGEIKVSGSVSIGDISSAEVAGHHIGGNIKDEDVERGTVSLFTKNLYNLDATLVSNGNEWMLPTIVNGVTEDATPTMPANLKRASTYTAIGWDFNNIWTIEENVSYPKLKSVQQMSGLSTPVGAANNYKAYTVDNNIHILGIETEATVSVYNVNGQMISLSTVTPDSMIPVPGKGLYLLRITENGISSSIKVLCK